MSASFDSVKYKLNYFYKNASWQKKFAFLPRRCAKTKTLIWLTHAYVGEVEFIYKDDEKEKTKYRCWIEKNLFLTDLLKGYVGEHND